MTKTFRDLDVASELCDALEADGITHPFPIQELTLPLALGGHDLIGQARTGTGKTLAFGLPLLQRVDPALKQTQALVIVPTRELCLQVYDDLSIGAALGLTSISVYGGVGYDEQIDALTGGAHVVVGTPGRLLDLFNRGVLNLSKVTELVLDEADEMLDMGFLPDVERLIEGCQGEDRHTMLFSATMPTAIVKLARRYMDHPTFTRADHEVKTTADNVTQHFFQVHRMDKPRLLARILQDDNRGGVYVFVRTKHMADRLVNDLEELRIPAIAIHGDLRQSTREKNLDRFREGKANVLVCTEVAARGLDVSGVTHVVNYDCPDDEKMYLHRIGRTARAGEAGVAITFAEFNEIDRLNVIRKKVEATDAAVHQVFSTSPVLDELFDLPAEKPWEHLTNVGGGKDGPRKPGGDRSSAKGGGSKGGGARSGGTRGGAKSGGATSGGTKDGGRSRSDAKDDSPRGGAKGDDSRSRTEDTKATDAGSRPGGASAEATSSDTTASDTTASDTTASGRRRPSSDGKPKSGRAREGRGGDHDSRPSTRSSGDTEPKRSGTDSTDETQDDAAAASADTSATRSRTRTRTRTRARAATTEAATAERRQGNDDGAERESNERPARPDTPRADRSGPDGDRADTGSGSTGSSGRTRARGGAPAKDRAASGDAGTPDRAGADSAGSSDRAASSESRQRARGGRNRQSRSRSSSDSSTRNSDSDTGGGSGNRGARGDASSSDAASSRDQSRSSGRGRDGGSGESRGGQRNGGQRSGGQRSGGQGGGKQRSANQRTDSGSGSGQDPTVRLSKRGEDARGDGEPQLARRVKVEHLP